MQIFGRKQSADATHNVLVTNSQVNFPSLNKLILKSKSHGAIMAENSYL